MAKLSRSTLWRRKNPERVKAQRRDSYVKTRAMHLLRDAARRAKDDNLLFDLRSHSAHYELVIEVGKCELTGLPFVIKSGTGRPSPFAPSLDRIIPELGYTHGNVRVVLWAVNKAIGEWGEAVYEQIAKSYLAKKRAMPWET